MSSRQTRSGLAAKTGANTKKTPSKSINGPKATSSKSDGGGSTIKLTPASTLKDVKAMLKDSMPFATVAQINDTARNVMAGLKSKDTDKERQQKIQDKNEAMMEEEKAVDEEGTDDGGSEDEQEPEVSTPPRRKRAAAKATSPDKVKVKPKPRKRKLPQVSDGDASDREDIPKPPERKRAKPRSPPKTVQSSSPEAIVVHNDDEEVPRRNPGSPGKKNLKVELLVPDRRSTKPVSKDERELISLFDAKVKSGGRGVKGKDNSPDEEGKEWQPGSEDDELVESSEHEVTKSKAKTGGPAKQLTKTDADRKGKGKAAVVVEDSDDASKASKQSGDEDADGESASDKSDPETGRDDEIIVKLEDEPKRKKSKVTGKASEKKTAKTSEEKGEFRVYLALENAWPRSKGTYNEKIQAPLKVIDDTAKKYAIFQTTEFRKLYDPLWHDPSSQDEIRKAVYKITPQFRQEVKQKAKKAVDRHFFMMNVPTTGEDGKKLSVAAQAERVKRAKDARAIFLKKDYNFHHGELEMPDHEVNPSLWKGPDRGLPYHNPVIGDVIARQWWQGQHPEAVRQENHERFDLKKPLSSNLIALACSAILNVLDEIIKDATIFFDEKTYAPEHDRLQAAIDKLRRLGNPQHPSYKEGLKRLVKSMNDTLVENIRVTAGIAPNGVEDDDNDQDAEDKEVAISMDDIFSSRFFTEKEASSSTAPTTSQRAALSRQATDVGGSTGNAA